MLIGLDDFSLMSRMAESTAVSASMPEFLLAYIGPGSGLELIAQFLALLAFMTTAFLAVLFQPLVTFFRYVRGKLTGGGPESLATSSDQPQDEPDTTQVSPAQLGTEERQAGSLPKMVSESPSDG